ncbi:MAG: U3 snoRNP protein [Thelocarpon superellum]|nr:MAG: U3 snoRNP protein [Thelocarpon superellum]
MSRGVRKGGTVSSKHHRFESFTQRLAKITIEPVRRVRRRDLDEDDAPATASYFKAALEKWDDLNTSEGFTAFARAITPFCDSLPQLVHFQDRIADLLVLELEKRNALSLEALLALTAQFAHDLGPQFEKHYARIMSVVAAIAASHPDVDVIEWSFTCLAWLFKYLSRLLVPDLRPTYDLMAPLLGREHQKPFVTRFAAEALSFLVRRAGTIHHRDHDPLERIVAHALDDLEHATAARKTSLYQQGSMALWAEAIKGIGRSIHSSGPTILRCLMERALQINPTKREGAEHVMCGVLTNVLHHTDADTFQPLIDVILSCVDQASSQPTQLVIAGRLLFIVAGVRKGSRVGDWRPWLKACVMALPSAVDLVSDEAFRRAMPVVAATAIILHSAPLDITLPYFRPIVELIADSSLPFLFFCNYLASLDPKRFRGFVLPYFQRFLLRQWEESEASLCLLIAKWSTLDGMSDGAWERIACPEAWQSRMLQAFRQLANPGERVESALEVSRDDIYRCNAYLDILDSISCEPAVRAAINHDLRRLLSTALRTDLTLAPETASFALGHGFISYVAGCDQVDVALWPALLSHGGHHVRCIPFLQGLLAYLKKLADLDPEQPLLIAVRQNLASPSSLIRARSVQILQLLYQAEHGHSLELLSLALSIEETPLSLQSARTISMHIRRLATCFRTEEFAPWIRQLVPTYLFGLLNVPLSQVWEDATAALGQIASSDGGEQDVAGLAFRWLDEVPLADPIVGDTPDAPARGPVATAYQCTNVMTLTALLEKTITELRAGGPALERGFQEQHRLNPSVSPMARSQGLRVLRGAPHIAERRSRQLVPILLSWAGREEEVEEAEDDSSGLEVARTATTPGHWSRTDRKGMLSLFAQFINPNVLYKSADVYKTLLELLANGDVDLQKPALDAILTWKSPSLTTYQENLRNLLDDARFNDEVSRFVHPHEEDGQIQPEHRAELVPVLLRMLYGRIVARKGAASGKRGMTGRRKMVMKALAAFPDEELQDFISLALGSLGAVTLDELDRHELETESRGAPISWRRQLGMVKMVADLLTELGRRLAPFTEALLRALLYALIGVGRTLSHGRPTEDMEMVEGVGIASLKNIRQTGYHGLQLLFVAGTDFEWQPYMSTVFRELVSPRLPNLPIETAQSPSGVLQLFSTWSRHETTVFFLVDYDGAVVGKVMECLVVPSAKEDVKLHALSVVTNLLDLWDREDALSDEGRARLRADVIQPHIETMLGRLGDVLVGSPGKDLLELSIRTVQRLAPFVAQSAEVRKMITIALFLLDQPLRRVAPRMKSDLLGILQHLVPLHHFELDHDLQEQIFTTISSLFNFFRDRASRVLLSNVLMVLAQEEQQLRAVAAWCLDLNAFSPERVDEPDFDRRLKAFSQIAESHYLTLTARQWRPVLHNMLYYIKDQEELAIRANASFALRRFVEGARGDRDGDREEMQQLLSAVLLPALRHGMRDASELVRAEYLSVLAHAITHFPAHPELCDLHGLLMGGDEEASFFGNVLHIQQHRRLRALRRLTAAAQQGQLGSDNISHMLLPLLEHFISLRTEDGSGQSLAAETVTTVGCLLEWVEWAPFRAIFKRFIGYFESSPEPEKIVIRLLGATADALGRAAEVRMDADTPTTPSPLSRTMPVSDRLGHVVTATFVPSMTRFLRHKNDAVVSLRIPVAVTIVKLLKLLPPAERSDRLPPVLTDICHILRSRAQESRDLARKTLAEIMTLLGSDHFGFVLKELRGALARGYQLHVLSYTVHSILVTNTSLFGPGDLDYCLPQIVAVVMDDIFGVTGQEKDAEDYISTMKEVKSRKSFDSMELMASMTTISRLGDLVKPLQALLAEKLNAKLVRKIDELLRRIGVGLIRNPAVFSRDFLVFCYELIHSIPTSPATGVVQPIRQDGKPPLKARQLIRLTGAKKTHDRGRTTVYDYKIVRFALDILRAVLHKYPALQTASSMAAFMTVIRDCLPQGQEEVQMSAVRLLTAIIKVPLPEMDQEAEAYIIHAVRLVKTAVSMNTELAQASLKLVSAILRERRDVGMESTKLTSRLAFLLERLKPELQEPDRQGASFNFLKAVMARKILLPEVYDVMDRVASIMVTDQTRSTRDLARGCYFQFLMEYPQGTKRFAKQMAFLVKNLEYPYPDGRQSVLEVMHLLITKVGDGMIDDILGTIFVPCVMVLSNDESDECRDMAAALLRQCLERAPEERIRTFVALLRAWLDQEERLVLRRVALQCYDLYVDVQPSRSETEVPLLRAHVLEIIQQPPTPSELNGDYSELAHVALHTWTRICHAFPPLAFALASQPLWSAVDACLSWPHAGVKLVGSSLVGSFLADFARTHATTGLAQLPLTGSAGLRLGSAEILHLTRRSIGVLRGTGLTEALATQTVRNLIFLGKCLGASRVLWKTGPADEDPADAEEDEETPSAEDGDTALVRLFERLSVILRREPVTTRAAALVGKTASLQLMAALCSHLSTDVLAPCLLAILLPLHHLTDEHIAAPHSSDPSFQAAYKALQASSHEIMALLQQKVGTTAYVTQYAQVQRAVRARREVRRVKRRIGAVMEPERMQRDKRRKEERKKVKRKERSAEERGKRRGW